MKVSAYTGMNLRGEVRESISLDEDDLSDVEDEVFIRDGKTGYKLAEDLTVKRPLMAPSRRRRREDIFTSSLRSRSSCKDFCRPWCYVFAALSVLIGLIILVVVVVSIYPLPLDKLRGWLVRKTQGFGETKTNLLPCDNLKVTDVWSVSLPKLTTDSPVRVIDVDNDGFDDVIFGFGTGDNYNILPPDIFCPVFMGVAAPCEGGVIALNGLTGDIIWRNWFNDTIFSLQCTADVNGDNQNDCLIVGMEGTIATINTKNGTTIWSLNTGRLNVFVASFIPDQNNDSVSDIIASHSSLTSNPDGHLILFSGKTGETLKNLRIPNDAKTFYMPQILKHNDNNNSFIIFGTGSPSSGGNLTVVPIEGLKQEIITNITTNIYEDKYKGIITPSVLVDITGDTIPDIITAMYNSTLVAINGKTFNQVWNFTIPGSNPETNISPTPAYFNSDNITDFLIVYQKYDDILNYNYTQTYIIDGKTGESLYKPLTGGVITQSSGLTVSLESFGYDMYLFWTSECANLKKTNTFKGLGDIYGECLDNSNSTLGLKLNALSQFHEPPGFVVYNSVERISKEFNTSVSVLKQLKDYLKSHTKILIDEPLSSLSYRQKEPSSKFRINEPLAAATNFRHKNRNENYISVANEEEAGFPEVPGGTLLEQDYDNNYYPSMEETIPYSPKHSRLDQNPEMANNRDPRSKDNFQRRQDASSTKKKNLSEKVGGIYDYHNVKRSRNRLLHDVDYVPTEILKDTYVKNEEMRLRRSKFEQRDVNTHVDRIKEKEEIQNIIKKQIEEAKKNESLTLWDLESEKEMKEWLDKQYRGKREANFNVDDSVKITSVGAILVPSNTTNASNYFDVVFITYWQPAVKKVEEFLQQDIEECINDKINQAKAIGYEQKTTDKEQRDLFESECREEQKNLKTQFNFFDDINKLRLGQMNIYRLRIECECVNKKGKERCAGFLPKEKQSWPAYLGAQGDGNYYKRD